MGWPIPEIQLLRSGVSAVLLADRASDHYRFEGIEEVLQATDTDIRLFGKPTTRPYRRMGVVLTTGSITAEMGALREKANRLKEKIQLVYSS